MRLFNNKINNYTLPYSQFPVIMDKKERLPTLRARSKKRFLLTCDHKLNHLKVNICSKVIGDQVIIERNFSAKNTRSERAAARQNDGVGGGATFYGYDLRVQSVRKLCRMQILEVLEEISMETDEPETFIIESIQCRSVKRRRRESRQQDDVYKRYNLNLYKWNDREELMSVEDMTQEILIELLGKNEEDRDVKWNNDRLADNKTNLTFSSSEEENSDGTHDDENDNDDEDYEM